eukprot:Gb_26535 [translate_table: standard]
MNQRYHHNLEDSEVAHHVEQGCQDGLFTSNVASCTSKWTIIMDNGTGFTAQLFFHSYSWINNRLWINGQMIISSLQLQGLIVMSKGT